MSKTRKRSARKTDERMKLTLMLLLAATACARPITTEERIAGYKALKARQASAGAQQQRVAQDGGWNLGKKKVAVINAFPRDFTPPLTLTQDELDEMVPLLDKHFQDASGGLFQFEFEMIEPKRSSWFTMSADGSCDWTQEAIDAIPGQKWVWDVTDAMGFRANPPPGFDRMLWIFPPCEELWGFGGWGDAPGPWLSLQGDIDPWWVSTLAHELQHTCGGLHEYREDGNEAAFGALGNGQVQANAQVSAPYKVSWGWLDWTRHIAKGRSVTEWLEAIDVGSYKQDATYAVAVPMLDDRRSVWLEYRHEPRASAPRGLLINVVASSWSQMAASGVAGPLHVVDAARDTVSLDDALVQVGKPFTFPLSQGELLLVSVVEAVDTRIQVHAQVLSAADVASASAAAATAVDTVACGGTIEPPTSGNHKLVRVELAGTGETALSSTVADQLVSEAVGNAHWFMNVPVQLYVPAKFAGNGASVVDRFVAGVNDASATPVASAQMASVVSESLRCPCTTHPECLADSTRTTAPCRAFEITGSVGMDGLYKEVPGRLENDGPVFTTVWHELKYTPKVPEFNTPGWIITDPNVIAWLFLEESVAAEDIKLQPVPLASAWNWGRLVDTLAITPLGAGVLSWPVEHKAVPFQTYAPDDAPVFLSFTSTRYLLLEDMKSAVTLTCDLDPAELCPEGQFWSYSSSVCVTCPRGTSAPAGSAGVASCQPACPAECARESIGNGRCDAVCMLPGCGFDGGDCEAVNAPREYCAPTCPVISVGNGVCFAGCNVASCSSDEGDCGGVTTSPTSSPVASGGTIAPSTSPVASGGTIAPSTSPVASGGTIAPSTSPVADTSTQAPTNAVGAAGSPAFIAFPAMVVALVAMQ